MNRPTAILLATALLLLAAPAAASEGLPDAPAPAGVFWTQQDPIACQQPKLSALCDGGETPPGSCAIVCAVAQAGARAFWCYNHQTYVWSPCWSGWMYGHGWGELGLITVVLDGAANQVPLHDWCTTQLGEPSCNVGDSADEYPGNMVFVAGTVTVTTAYGSDVMYSQAQDAL
jgi:hypothetical protein